MAVPLLLGNAYHGRVDAPAAFREAVERHPRVRVVLAPVLGTDPGLLAALDARLAEARAATAPGPAGEPRGVVLASAGTGDPAVRATLERLARHRQRPGGPLYRAAYASGPGPRVGEAVAALRAGGVAHVEMASWFLAPGVLYSRARADALEHGVQVVADTLGDAPAIIDLILRRYDAAGRSRRRVA